ncbi:MAG: aldo/keto reductase [Hyphomicrobiales bacterium]
MEKVSLGRTGLEVSVAGLGAGGHSRLGQSYGNSFQQSVDVVKAALDLGINFLDTAAVYGTEEIVGAAVKGVRDDVVISTKVQIVKPGTPALGQEFKSATEFCEDADICLSRLGVDEVDILHLHGVMPAQYSHCANELLPALEKLRAQGKVRFFGLTERFIHDPQHEMLKRALQDNHWDVVMTGFNMINHSAVEHVLKPAQDKGIGTLIMFAVRRALSNPEGLVEIIDQLVGEGLIDRAELGAEPFDFLMSEGGASSIVDGAYRYCRHTDGAHVILTGTGKISHLRENVASISSPPLSSAAIDHISKVFGGIDSVSCN